MIYDMLSFIFLSPRYYHLKLVLYFLVVAVYDITVSSDLLQVRRGVYISVLMFCVRNRQQFWL